MVQLIHHHSQAADGLICPLLYPAARREQPSLLRGSTATSIEGGGGSVGLDDWEIDRSEIMMRNKLGKQNSLLNLGTIFVLSNYE